MNALSLNSFVIAFSLGAALVVSGCGAKEGPAPAASDAAKPAHAKPHRSPIAGAWYPADRAQLGAMLDGFLAQADIPSSLPAQKAIAFIVPHAGYAYSGPTAAYAYKTVALRKPKRVIVIGPSHYVGFHGLSIGDNDCYETPFGPIPVDTAAVARLRKCPLIQALPEADAREHSVDIQIPFLARVLPEGSFKIIPIMAGQVEAADYAILADAIKGALDKDTVVIASSDFTHYGADFDYMPFPLDGQTRANLERLDMGAVQAIMSLSREKFLDYKSKTGITACGHCPIALTLSLLPPDTRPALLKYAVSGDREKKYEHSVSYVSLAFLSDSGIWPSSGAASSLSSSPSERKAIMSATDVTLNEAEKQTLLRVARDTLEMYVKSKKTPDLKGGAYPIAEKMKITCGAFVSLHKKGDLRGCIGHIVGQMSMAETVRENTVNAAVKDYRFSPVTPDELKDIDIEISVLSPLEPVRSTDEIVLGKHGIVLRQGFYQAVFLPQVAPEQGWNLEQTLGYLSEKAGLAKNAWKKPETKFLVFTAQVFGEKKQ
ncbi:MAG: AmmeMemoRadiSam system protein B [Candidatus Sumerlaeota bacterium]|nr:AmmeMemoRadiSam system protein B [Candidatus Sumerlaeota bacterium]